MTRKSPRKYTQEFKEEAVKLVLEHGYSQQQAADSLGISSKNINRWIGKHNPIRKEAISAEEQELRALRKENKRLRLEKEIL